MGIYIKVRQPNIPPIGKILAESRLIIAKKAVNFFSNYGFFNPKNVELWMNAGTDLLGGRYDGEFSINSLNEIDDILLRKYSSDEYSYGWYNSIIKIKGIWNINNEYYQGYFSVNNSRRWRNAYYDISIDAFGPYEKSGFIELLKDYKDYEYILSEFFKQITLDKINNIGNVFLIIASHGAPQSGEINDLVAIHVPSWRYMIHYLYDTMKDENEDYYDDHIQPIDQNFFISSLTVEKGIEDIYSVFSSESQIIELEGGSVTYIGKEDDSFKLLYNKFKEDIFKKAANKLPNKEEIKDKIYRGIGGDIIKERQKKIDDVLPKKEK